jgi:GTP-binding protein
MFFDEAKIFVASGKGGDGIVHFRKEKYIPRGGPDGGDGGKGGDIVIRVEPTMNTLSAFRRQRHFRAEDGKKGGGNDKFGRYGQDLIIAVPPGTVIRDSETGQLLGDLVNEDQQLIVCEGGRGGRGNARFATSRNQAPRMAEKGAPAQERWLELELRLIADIGVVGVPNAGKSTFLSVVTNAKPKIADYPFTTLQPNLGVADLDEHNSIILADIPGLIEGAHQGAGLGTAFLRHIQRTRILIHLIDGNSTDPLADFSQVNAEMALFDEDLGGKPQIVAINKVDIPQVRERLDDLMAMFKTHGFTPYKLSALTGEGARELLYAAARELERAEPVEPTDEELPTYSLGEDEIPFVISREPDGAWRISGKAVEQAALMTYWEYDEAVVRFQRMLERLGVEAALNEAGIESGDTVRIGEHELEWVT